MKTKEEIIKELNGMSIHSNYQRDCIKNTIDYIESINLYKIDEDRMKEVFNRRYVNALNWENSETKQMFDEYNSTLPERKELEPLPSVDGLANSIHKNCYECLTTPLRITSQKIAQYIVNKYSLPKRDEFPFNLKEGDKFVFVNPKTKEKSTETFFKSEIYARLFIDDSVKVYCDSYDCTPYVEPELKADDVIKKHNLTEQEVKAIREGVR